MKDLTAELMGDPAAAMRRAPTDEERFKHGASNSGYQLSRKSGRGAWQFWPVGEERQVETGKKARRMRDQIRRNYGHIMLVRQQPDGTYTVTRVE
jgi:hypothetical protein